MGNKSKAILIIFFSLLLLPLLVTGCSKKSIQQINEQNKITNDTSRTNPKNKYISTNQLKDGILIREIDINSIKDEQLNIVIKNETLENGVYGFFYKDEVKYYVFFNGVKITTIQILHSILRTNYCLFPII
ncbi:hypothetical protein TR13x_00620 [Caloranaerobacter sp. TR13]|uniref:hypothetical protein n=1 Tax=Caloranaerobacter sp. TR13 TaxID=1302151 RepID=UPI0006D44619|nr:hypothetical protein [Caloranaerobacter sp. TR13]KPU27891.1 hypothetical protein TR13x_00620 [Caloranaerobacter sp. TR13]